MEGTIVVMIAIEEEDDRIESTEIGESTEIAESRDAIGIEIDAMDEEMAISTTIEAAPVETIGTMTSHG